MRNGVRGPDNPNTPKCNLILKKLKQIAVIVLLQKERSNPPTDYYLEINKIQKKKKKKDLTPVYLYMKIIARIPWALEKKLCEQVLNYRKQDKIAYFNYHSIDFRNKR